MLEISSPAIRSGHSLETAHLRRDLTGQRFGRLFVISFSHMAGKQSYWVCACTCGNLKTLLGNNLRQSSGTRSCGCLRVEHVRTKMIPKNIIHGLGSTRIYRTWSQMLARCYNKNNIRYSVYGKRGITVCEEWRTDFMVFREWALSNGYRDDLQIDRIDNDRGYSPQNCRFVTAKENASNRKRTKVYQYQGRLFNQTDLAKELGVSQSTLWERLARGQSVDTAIEGILKRKQKINHKTRGYGRK